MKSEQTVCRRVEYDYPVKYEVRLSTPLPVDALEKNTLYVCLENDQIHYAVLTPQNRYVKSVITSAECQRHFGREWSAIVENPQVLLQCDEKLRRLASERNHVPAWEYRMLIGPEDVVCLTIDRLFPNEYCSQYGWRLSVIGRRGFFEPQMMLQGVFLTPEGGGRRYLGCYYLEEDPQNPAQYRVRCHDWEYHYESECPLDSDEIRPLSRYRYQWLIRGIDVGPQLKEIMRQQHDQVVPKRRPLLFCLNSAQAHTGLSWIKAQLLVHCHIDADSRPDRVDPKLLPEEADPSYSWGCSSDDSPLFVPQIYSKFQLITLKVKPSARPIIMLSCPMREGDRTMYFCLQKGVKNHQQDQKQTITEKGDAVLPMFSTDLYFTGLDYHLWANANYVSVPYDGAAFNQRCLRITEVMDRFQELNRKPAEVEEYLKIISEYLPEMSIAFNSCHHSTPFGKLNKTHRRQLENLKKENPEQFLKIIPFMHDLAKLERKLAIAMWIGLVLGIVPGVILWGVKQAVINDRFSQHMKKQHSPPETVPQGPLKSGIFNRKKGLEVSGEAGIFTSNPNAYTRIV